MQDEFKQTFRPHVIAYVSPILALLAGGALAFPGRSYLAGYWADALYSISGMHYRYVPEIVKWLDRLVFAVGGIVFVLALVTLLGAFVRRQTSSLMISKDQVVWRTGWLNLSEKSVSVTEVIGVSLDQSLAGRLIGFGNIDIETRGVDHITVGGIESPDTVQELLRRLKSRV